MSQRKGIARVVYRAGDGLGRASPSGPFPCCDTYCSSTNKAIRTYDPVAAH